MVQVQGLPFRDEFRDKGLGLGVQGSRCAVLSDLGLGADGAYDLGFRGLACSTLSAGS